MANRDPRMYQIIDSKYRPYTVKSNGMRVVNSGIDDKRNLVRLKNQEQMSIQLRD